MSISLLDAKYESELCKQLLEISRYIYATEAGCDMPTASQVMTIHKDASPLDIRAQIQDNLDFVRVNVMYATFDREALKRELKKAKSKGPGGQ